MRRAVPPSFPRKRESIRAKEHMDPRFRGGDFLRPFEMQRISHRHALAMQKKYTTRREKWQRATEHHGRDRVETLELENVRTCQRCLPIAPARQWDSNQISVFPIVRARSGTWEREHVRTCQRGLPIAPAGIVA